jgi:hypothetical protein
MLRLRVTHRHLSRLTGPGQSAWKSLASQEPGFAASYASGQYGAKPADEERGPTNRDASKYSGSSSSKDEDVRNIPQSIGSKDSPAGNNGGSHNMGGQGQTEDRGITDKAPPASPASAGDPKDANMAQDARAGDGVS